MNYPGMGTQIPAKKERSGISGSTLKIIAIVTMLIDHIGASVLGRLLQTHGINELNVADISALTQWMSDNSVLFWSYTIMRMIGRVAFPIFCFLLIQGFLHTHDVKKYAARLFAFALISELPFDLAFKGKIDFSYQNVFFTLFIGLMTMIPLDRGAYGLERMAARDPLYRGACVRDRGGGAAADGLRGKGRGLHYGALYF